METEELCTSFSTAGVTEETEIRIRTGHRCHFGALLDTLRRENVTRGSFCHNPNASFLIQPRSTPELAEREAALRQKIELLKRDREAISLPKPSSGTEAETGPRTCQQAGARAKMADAKKEKASLFYELISVRVGASHSNISSLT